MPQAGRLVTRKPPEYAARVRELSYLPSVVAPLVGAHGHQAQEAFLHRIGLP